MEPPTATTQALSETDDYLLFDPRANRTRTAQGKGRMQFQEGIVFVVGGGGYVEYTNLMEWAGRDKHARGGEGNVGVQGAMLGKGWKKVTYGSTEIVTPGRFVQVLSELGKHMS